MKLVQNVRLGAWILVALNLIMAFGSIWVFMRMAPAIEIIIEQNERSLHACEEMLSSLAMVNQSEIDVKQFRSAFLKALERAKNNITEKEEPVAIEEISKNYVLAFEGSIEGKKKTLSAIQHLSEINSSAMVKEDQKARQFGNAGAWGIVFMASAVFMVGMLFMRSLKRNLVNPLEEIHSVIQAIRNGDNMRRCTGPDMHKDIKTIFSGINDLLDKNTSHFLSSKKEEE
jgi:hypothetical protein